MNYKHNHQSLLYFAAAILLAVTILTGCGPQKFEPIETLPESESAAETLAILVSRSQNAGPMRANGRCLWQYHSKGKPQKEDFAVKLWVNPIKSHGKQGSEISLPAADRPNPPAQIYMQGDVGFDARGIVVGSNEQEFWMLIKPKASSYSWGRWSEQGSALNLTNISGTLVEALGIVEVVNEKNWSMAKKGPFDILTRRNDEGRIIKKLHVGSYDYLVRVVEYFDADEKVVAVVKLGKYKRVYENFFVPGRVGVVVRGPSVEESASVALTLDSIKPTSFSEEQLNLFFNRPKTKGYKHIYRIINGRMTELHE
jgi:mRNA-degrading endonuclease RelE of RelBE toxin-antitoxin system